MSKLYTKFVSQFLFPLHESIKGHRTVSCLKQLEHSQWQPFNQLKRQQSERLRAFLIEVNQQSPYYRRLFQEARLDVTQVKSIEQLQAIPFLEKQLIRDKAEQIKYKQAIKLVPYRTGGSSGEPLQFYVSKKRIAHDVAAKWRATRWWEVDIGDKELVVWGAGIECQKQSWIRNARDIMLRSYLIPARNLTQLEMDKIIAFIQSYRPKMLFGYPSILCYLAKYAQQKHQTLNHYGIKVAFVTSEVLDEGQKQTIQSVFGCAVANGYGGRDAGFIAHMCPAGSMHVTYEDIIIEIINEQGQACQPGQLGEIVITHLASTGFPFIRYRTGDMGIYEESHCICKRNLPVLKKIVGRKSDLIYAQNGAAVHRAEIVKPITALGNIERFQFIQKKMDYAILKIKGHHLNKQQQEKLLNYYKTLLGEQFTLDIQYVDSIAFESSGKYKFVISELHQ